MPDSSLVFPRYIAVSPPQPHRILYIAPPLPPYKLSERVRRKSGGKIERKWLIPNPILDLYQRKWYLVKSVIFK